ncbi:MAG: tRNA (N(6)-L-threonylcarbamoyladenosine(37)-C(2))-methylthiotransferase MtaB [Defluviitaleaceae bacterium]|nr:tRNA (N(6)-L-threonylcarbamoyladenosine(37)-C(2))-methylthiotransferase MtaB [Defluviitaleaceae bacterium]
MKKKLKIAATTLGCKVNVYDTDAMLSAFRASGHLIVGFSEIADVYIVNTCTVTNFGDKKSRQMLRNAKKTNPDAIVVAAGCYTQTSPEEIKKIDGVNILIGTKERSKIVEIVENYAKNSDVENYISDIMNEQVFESLEVDNLSEKTRAYIKIQEGCNNFCTYCIIPYARGPVRSRNIEDIVSEAKKLSSSGYKEVVLAGINVASYGKDLNQDVSLLDVLEEVHKINEIKRIRFSSIEPTVITNEFIECLKTLPKICDHFHLSLQSGCDKTLQAMNRKYLSEDYRQAILKIRKIMPNASITTDIIVGFPGETEKDFLESYDFAKEMQLSKIHVFPYSPKKGTKAAEFKAQIPNHIKNERSKKMIELGEEMQREFLKSFIGKNLSILFEKRTDAGFYEGYSTNYIPVKTYSQKCLENEIFELKMLKIEDFWGII